MPYAGAMNKAKDPQKAPSQADKQTAAQVRKARLADALKDNLQKRKAQARARDGSKGPDEPESSS